MSDSVNNKEEAQKDLEAEAAVAEAMAVTQERKPEWGAIIKDLLVLMAVAAVLGVCSKLAMKPFEIVYEAQDMVSLARKSSLDVKKWVDEPFLKELHARLEAAKKEGSDFINCVDNTGRTPLMWVCYSNFNEPQHLSKSLTKRMVVPASVTDLAVLNEVDLKRLYYIRRMLEVPGIDVTLKDQDGFTALHWAAWSGMPFCSLLMAEKGLDVNAAENNGYTPLMLAARRGNLGAVSMLLQMGADASLKNKDGYTALDLAKAAGAAYKKRDAFSYRLVYSAPRADEYDKVVAMLQNPPAVQSLEALAVELEEVESAFRLAAGRVAHEEEAAAKSAAAQKTDGKKASESAGVTEPQA